MVVVPIVATMIPKSAPIYLPLLLLLLLLLMVVHFARDDDDDDDNCSGNNSVATIQSSTELMIFKYSVSFSASVDTINLN